MDHVLMTERFSIRDTLYCTNRQGLLCYHLFRVVRVHLSAGVISIARLLAGVVNANLLFQHVLQ